MVPSTVVTWRWVRELTTELSWCVEWQQRYNLPSFVEWHNGYIFDSCKLVCHNFTFKKNKKQKQGNIEEGYHFHLNSSSWPCSRGSRADVLPVCVGQVCCLVSVLNGRYIVRILPLAIRYFTWVEIIALDWHFRVVKFQQFNSKCFVLR